MFTRVRESLRALVAKDNLSRVRLPNQENKGIHPEWGVWNASIKETQGAVLTAFYESADVFCGFQVGFPFLE